MKHLFRTIVVACTVFLACGPFWTRPVQNGSMDNPGRYTVCLRLPAEQLPAANDAVKEWDTALGQWMHVVAIDLDADAKGEVGDPRSWCSIYVHQTTESHPTSATTLAWANYVGGGEISMKVGRYEQDVKGILMHELGHAFGAQHVAGTLMNPNWWPNEYHCPDQTTVMQVASWHHIDVSLLRWCYY